MESQDTMRLLREKKSNLESLKNKFKLREKNLKLMNYSIIAMSIIICVIKNIAFNNIIYDINSYFFNSIILLVILYSTILIIFIKMKNYDRLIHIENDIIRINEEIELLEISNVSLEQRAEKQLKLHQNELNRYYNENIRQMKGVYNIGIISISMGFIIIILTIILSILNKDKIDNLIIPIMGIVSGLLSSFIGTLFIKMYTETISTSAKFHDKLVYSNNLYFSNFLIAKVSNKNKREDITCEIAKTIAELK